MAFRIMYNPTLKQILDDLKTPDQGLFVDTNEAKCNRDMIKCMRERERLNPNYHQYYHDHNKRRIY